MKRRLLCIGLTLLVVGQTAVRSEDVLFSGPQVGETLPPLPVTSVLGATAGREIDLVKRADGQPTVLVFVHARTRPGFGLTNLLMRYTASRAKDGLHSGVIFLTEDVTKTEQWLRVVEKHFSPEHVVYGISGDGIEGPGSYGLNRNVTLTILVGKDGKVTANYPLVQPSVQADGPKVLKDIVAAMGGGAVPTLDELGGERYQATDRKPMKERAGQDDPQLTALLRDVIAKEATGEEVEAAVKKVNDYIAKNDNARGQLGRIASTVVNSGKLKSYGTPPAQKAIRQWAKEHGSVEKAAPQAGGEATPSSGASRD